MNWISKIGISVIACTLSLCTIHDSNAASFKGLNMQKAYSVSADGRVIAGKKSHLDDKVCLWSKENGLVDVEVMMGLPQHTTVGSLHLSADGQTLTGNYANNIMMSNGSYYWNAEDGLTLLQGSYCTGISDDGNVISGDKLPGNVPIRWMKEDDGIQPTNSFANLRAENVSGDGEIFVGQENYNAAFIWSKKQGLKYLGLKDAGFHSINASAISKDGRVVAGSATQHDDFHEIYRWTEAGGIETLGSISTNLDSGTVNDISADGSRIVGRYVSRWMQERTQGFVWDHESGMQSVTDFLVDNGLGDQIEGWWLYSVVGIADDNKTIIGSGYNPQGQEQAWVAVIPEPGVGVVLMGAMGLLSLRRQKQ